MEKLHSQIKDLTERLAEQEAGTETKLQQLAQDLYIQYSQKHEQKVSILKKGYETKWNGKLNNLEFDNKTLRREIESLKIQMENERNEKNQLVKLWDQFVEMEGDDDKTED
ncbi:hypothetical protein BABINDRAFT_35041 [Babjeviella inositovora NRRL Y-12698]|uniref:Uncharacterized protein n=1 Tax=Babjeviella inositovora NRRL Y-12698 TaxID=984486 RepID=A0A1E3QTH0_9ASCO|nr:uncharacterized protein BABINDRAFT_35041 [Babjeviella inositovora NRRL Y-12698]ODQ80844.1 hypothetical protein BABINDRAFT_35041 [Babjeviella inositovora NRRL Y-12698]